MDIRSGQINGTDVSGTKVAAVVDWPGAMLNGKGTGRLYFDSATSPAQRQALEGLILGKFGGGFSRIPELVPKVLPSRVATIAVLSGPEGTSIAVGDFGHAVVKPMRRSGELVRASGVGGFRDDLVLAVGAGSSWRDPELKQWDGGGYAEQSDFDWRG
jgi:hypothetical protein